MPETFDITHLTDKALRSIYNDEYPGPFNEDLWKITTRQLNQAVDEIYKNPKQPDKLFANKIKYQNSVFSAFKSTQQTTTLRHLKIASKATNFSEFKKKALSVTNDYNKNWLKQEYYAAKAKLRSAKNFRLAVKDSDLYPNIQYMPSVASEPREDHKKYYNIVRPINDPFWNTHLPPITWGCKCQWKTTDVAETLLPDQLPTPSPGLDINTGKSGSVFSNSHPYFEVSQKTAEDIMEQNIRIIHNKPVEKFTHFYFNTDTNGCCYSFEKLGREKIKNIRIGNYHASSGNDIQLFGEQRIDSLFNGIWHEFKTPESLTFNAFSKNLQKANKQLGFRNLKGDVTFELIGTVDKEILLEALNYRINRIVRDGELNINSLYFIVNGKFEGIATIDEIVAGKLPF